jgi:hypothetical protein
MKLAIAYDSKLPLGGWALGIAGDFWSTIVRSSILIRHKQKTHSTSGDFN